MEDSNKKFTFASKILSSNRNQAKELMDGLAQAGVDHDDLYNYMQVQAAKQSSTWFQPGKKLFGVVPKPNPDALSALAGGARNTAQSLPYADQTLKFLKSLSDEQFRQVMTNSSLFDQVAGMAGGAAASEKQNLDGLMQGVQQ